MRNRERASLLPFRLGRRCGSFRKRTVGLISEGSSIRAGKGQALDQFCTNFVNERCSRRMDVNKARLIRDQWLGAMEKAGGWVYVGVNERRILFDAGELELGAEPKES